MADIISLGVNSIVLGGAIFFVAFLMLLILWSAVVRTLYSVLGKSKFYFIPNTLKELFLSVAFIFLLISAFLAVLFTDRTLLTGEIFKIWEVLLIFAAANIVVRIVLTGLDAQRRIAKDRSGIYRSVGLLKGTAGLVLYLIALIISINVLSAEVGQVVTIMGLFVVVLLFATSFDQIKSIMAGLQLGDYYVDSGNLVAIDGHTGIVESVHGRSTLIKRMDGRTVVVPNFRFFSNTFVLDTAELRDMAIHTEVKGKDAAKIKEKISGISSKITIDLKDIPDEYKPKVYHSGVSEGRHLFTIVFKVTPESDIQKIVDSFCSQFSNEFKDSLISVKLK
jgi:small-conductance mechanosensitive channel